MPTRRRRRAPTALDGGGGAGWRSARAVGQPRKGLSTAAAVRGRAPPRGRGGWYVYTKCNYLQAVDNSPLSTDPVGRLPPYRAAPGRTPQPQQMSPAQTWQGRRGGGRRSRCITAGRLIVSRPSAARCDPLWPHGPPRPETPARRPCGDPSTCGFPLPPRRARTGARPSSPRRRRSRRRRPPPPPRREHCGRP